LLKQFLLRTFREGDLDQVMRINLTCLPENYTPNFFLDLHRRFPKTFLVAVADGKVVGYVMCRIELGFPDMGGIGIIRKGHVVSLAVLPEYRRRGIGKALMMRAMDGMLDYGARECFLEVRVSNLPAINLYEGLGFRPVRRNIGYYADGENALVMSRKLGTGFPFQVY